MDYWKTNPGDRRALSEVLSLDTEGKSYADHVTPGVAPALRGFTPIGWSWLLSTPSPDCGGVRPIGNAGGVRRRLLVNGSAQRGAKTASHVRLTHVYLRSLYR